ncbi:hypothetical protein D8I35_09455 [Corticibacter populi]|uniref:Phage gp6-like head-tail connector protein n=1 Tax=Corticibacter populi TaxID=1550736 RepID=A0A3M6QUK9_9BURK|nr:hypothetical protein [Corticibacter populi]RMX06717.1 hypothetical protein D8I35_09455 [Corticibacter populi]RZS31702.1 hypothetical protein EV687_2371 [Corticibacter populi]
MSNPTQPTVEEALLRLRLDADLVDDVANAIPQARAQVESYLKGPLCADAEAVAAAIAAGSRNATLCTPDVIAAQLLFVDVLVGSNDIQAQESKRTAAYAMLKPLRYMGI